MLLDRRSFTAGSAALLSGCATVGTQRSATCTPRVPVKVDASRVIRTMAGLRPYRRSGFVVRAEQLLGGTFELGQWDTTPEPTTIERILRGHPALLRGFPLHGLNRVEAPTT